MGSRVFIPCTKALVALDVSGDKLSIAWKLDGGSGPPIVAAGTVWALANNGILRAVDPTTGSVRYSTQPSRPVSRFISLSAAGGMVFVADGSKLTAFALR